MRYTRKHITLCRLWYFHNLKCFQTMQSTIILRLLNPSQKPHYFFSSQHSLALNSSLCRIETFTAPPSTSSTLSHLLLRSSYPGDTTSQQTPRFSGFCSLAAPSFAVFPESETWELYHRSIHWTGLQTSTFRLAVNFYNGFLCLLQRDISLVSRKDYTHLWKVVFLSEEQLVFQYQEGVPEIISIDITLILRFIKLHLYIYRYVCIYICTCTNN